MLIDRLNLPMAFRFARTRWWIIFALLSAPSLRSAEDLPTRVEPRNPATSVTAPLLKQIGAGVFELGQVRLDKEQKTVSFPALVNLREGNIEYLVVTTAGKTHESLLRTDAKPYHIQVALLLLGLKGSGTNTLPEEPAKPLPGDRVEIELSWKADAKLQRFRAEEFVHDRKAEAVMAKGPWIYNGSRLREDGFAAQIDGSIVSLITDADALLNNPRPGREDDDNWLVRTKHLPPLNSTVEVTIRLGGQRVK